SDVAEGFEQIIDFLSGSYINYALTVNPHVYISCIKQFWNTAMVKHSGDVTRLQALVDKKRIVITEEVVREILQLNDAKVVIFLPNEEIFAGLARMGYEKPSTKLTFYKAFFSTQWKFFIHTILHSLSAKRTSWNEFSSAMASAVLCRSSGQRFNFSNYIFESLVRSVDSSSKFYMYPRFIQLIIQTNIADLSKHTTRYISPVLTQKVFANMRRVGKGFSGVETPLFESMLVVRDVAEEAEAHVLAQGDDVQEPTAEEVVTDVVPPTPTPPSPPSPVIPSSHPHQPPCPPQLQDAEGSSLLFQQVLDTCSALARRVEGLETDKAAQQLEIVKLKARENDAEVEGRHADKQAEIYNIDLDHSSKVLSIQEDDTEVQEAVEIVTTAKLMTDVVTAAATQVVAARVVIRDLNEELSSVTPAETPKVKDKGKGILIEAPKPIKKKDQIEMDAEYARKLQEEINKEHEEAYKNIDWNAALDHNTEGYKMDFFKGMTYDEILPIFQAKFEANIRFLFKSREEMEAEDQEIIKSINETPAQKAAKRRKLSEEAQEADDLRKRLEIVQDEDDDVFIEATPLAQMVPVVDYQIVVIDNKPKIVRDIFSTSKPANFSDEYLLLTLQRMFEEPDGQDAIWRNQKSVHGLALVRRWKLPTSCGVHVITLSTVQLFLLVERSLRLMLFKDAAAVAHAKHMTGNKCYLTDFEAYDGGFVFFGDGKGRISGKGKIKTGKLDFDDVYFCKELKYNLFSVSQMCEKKNNVLFISTECLVLSSNFKLLDECQVLLRVPRKDNIYNVNLKSVVPTGVDSKLPATFWAEAVNTACYVLNKALVTKPHNKTPYELIHGRPPLIDFMKPFGYPVIILNTKDNLGKFEGKANEGYFVGYSVVRSKENLVAGQDDKPKELEQEYILIPICTTNPLISQGTKDSTVDAVKKALKVDKSKASNNVKKNAQVLRIHKLRRTNHKDFQNCLFACFLSQMEPKKPVQALQDLSWVEAMQDELLQFKLLKVWTLVDLPKDKWEIGTKWVYRNKKDGKGIVIENKARLLAHGHTQEEGIDYDEVFAPVARIEAIRLFLAYASFKDFVVYQMDVKSAFLYGRIEGEVYVCQPHGFEDPNFPDKVYKVEKALYGLHQAPRACVKTTSTPMESNNPLIKDEEAKDVDVHLYRSMIGSLMYLTVSRPDITFSTIVANSTTEAEYVTAANYCGQKPQKPRRKQRKEAKTSHDESKDEDHVPTPSSDPLPSGEDSFILNELMVFCTSLQEQVFDLQKAKDAQAKEIAALKKKVTKLTKWRESRSRGLRRLKRIGSGRRVKSPKEKDGLGAQKDASKQERMIEEINKNAEIALDDETQGRINDDEMFGVDDLAREEVVIDSAVELVTIVKDSAAPTIDVTEDEITMAQALAALKSVKPKVVVQEQEMSTIIPAAATIVITAVLTLRAKVPDDGDEVIIEATPIPFRSPTIIDYKIHKKGNKNYFKIIRANGNSQVYQTFERMFKNFNREDLEVLWAIVKDRFKKKKPVDDMDNILFRTLKTMFEHHVKDTIWKYQQGLAKVKNWKLFESSTVYCMTMQSAIYYLLVENVYPLTRNTLHQLWSDVRLQVDYDVKMAYDLLRFIGKQLMEGYTP
nr:hypothetical protein [Tanacetum cinerariifolium]